MIDLPIAFVTHVHEPPGLEVLINFGVFAGREATPAEIDDLAAAFLAAAPQVSIISEQRHEIGPHVEASLHQVRVEIATDSVPGKSSELEELERQLVDAAEDWARACAADRHAEVTDL
jgi:hypothetical protein